MPLELAELKEEIETASAPPHRVVENLFMVMDLRRVLKEFLVQQISVSDGKVFLLFHPESPVKVDKLLELIKKQKNSFRLAPDGRLSFTPQNQEWEGLLVGEVMQMLHLIRDDPPQQSLLLESVARMKELGTGKLSPARAVQNSTSESIPSSFGFAN